jgi:hypothetical protein
MSKRIEPEEEGEAPPRPMMPMGGPPPSAPEVDTDVDKVAQAPMMAVRNVRKLGGRRPQALADIDD